MTRIILSTSNLISGSSSISRRSIHEKSNAELTGSLRTNFQLAQQTAQQRAQAQSNSNGHSNGSPNHTAWTQTSGSTVYVPSLESSNSALAEERSQYDITVKLFFLPTTDISQRCAHTQEAVSLVLKELNAPSIDLLIVSFPGITFDADDDEDEEDQGPSGAEDEEQELEDIVKTWQTLEGLQTKGVVRQIGLSEFGTERLKKFLPRTKIRPSVDQINVRDCCVVPKPLILYAKQEKIELLTHNDCVNILPKGTIRELLGPGEGAGVLSDGTSEGLKGEVDPQWVVKYTAVVKDRGVIENKGYFAMAEIRD